MVLNNGAGTTLDSQDIGDLENNVYIVIVSAEASELSGGEAKVP